MALTKLTTDLNYHQAQDDEPNDAGGLTAAEFKELCDQAANDIKDYLNNTLVPETDAEITRQVENAEMAPGNIVLKVGGVEPETGPCLWVDTSALS